MCKHDNASCSSDSKAAEAVLGDSSDTGQSENRSYRNELIADLVSDNPLRACVFEEFRIDFCCGGKISLADLCKRDGYDLAELERRLAAVDAKAPNETDWKKASLANLTRHIVKTYHEPLQEQLKYVSKLAQKVARVHGEKHKEMVAVENVFSYFRSELEAHMQKEEMILFPAIVSIERGEQISNMSCGFNVQMPISVMLREHEEAESMLAQFRELTQNYNPPVGACHSFKVLLFLLHTIETDLQRHVQLENNILFPRVLELQKRIIQIHQLSH